MDRVFSAPATERPVVHVERQDHAERFVLAASDQFARSVRAFAKAVIAGERPPEWAAGSLDHAALVDAVRDGARSVFIA
jgi:dTDP-3,4-didehydro-2,6-dideoxy-alpha-D-glucose 3-reductase